MQNMEKKLRDIATKAQTDAAKIASEIVVEEIARLTGDSIENKIVDQVTSVGKSKKKEKTKKVEEIYIPPEKNAANTL